MTEELLSANVATVPLKPRDSYKPGSRCLVFACMSKATGRWDTPRSSHAGKNPELPNPWVSTQGCRAENAITRKRGSYETAPSRCIYLLPKCGELSCHHNQTSEVGPRGELRTNPGI